MVLELRNISVSPHFLKMPISKLPLGLNARNFLFITKFNFRRAKHLADDKIATKRLLSKKGIPTSRILSFFRSREDVLKFSWKLPEEGFVIKPTRGYGGQGILVVKKWDGEKARTIMGQSMDKKAIRSLLFDILEGAFSLQFLPDSAYIEELITPDPFFKKFSPVGLPDVRIIVFNKIPVMAMLRLPSAESEGKANLHAGAYGIGIALRTGITTYGVYKGKPLQVIPNTRTIVSGIKIPDWDKILTIASKAQVVSGLGFAGIDVVLDKDRGPLVLEINTRPGLSIQMANQASLRTRLERVENIDVPTPERGVELGKSLFAEREADSKDQAKIILSVIEKITLGGANSHSRQVLAKLDTGAYRTSLDRQLAKQLGLRPSGEKILIKSASGNKHRRAYHLTFKLHDKPISTVATIVDRSHLKYPVIIGRKDLKGFLVNPIIPKNLETTLETTDTYN